MTLLMFPLPLPLANPTHSATVHRMHIRRFWHIEMTGVAAIFRSMTRCWADTSQHVQARGHWLKVRWIYAAAVAAEVIKMQAALNRPDSIDVSQAVGTLGFAVAPVAAVSSRVAVSRPWPARFGATGAVDFRPEAVR